MVGIVLISHGAFCEGLLSSLKMIAGDDCGICAVPLFPGTTAEAYRKKLSEVLKLQDNESGTLILSDIKSGTPFQSAAYLAKDFKIGLVSGMNMPMLLSAALERTEETTLEEMVKQASDPETTGVEGTLFKKGERKHREKLSVNKNR